MSAMSDYLELKFLDHITANASFTMPSALYLGLAVGDFTDTGTGQAELSGGGYARQQVAFDTAANGVTANTSDVSFPAATTSLGTISHWGLFDAATGGNMLLHGSFASAKLIESQDILRISAGDLDLTAA